MAFQPRMGLRTVWVSLACGLLWAMVGIAAIFVVPRLAMRWKDMGVDVSPNSKAAVAVSQRFSAFSHTHPMIVGFALTALLAVQGVVLLRAWHRPQGRKRGWIWAVAFLALPLLFLAWMVALFVRP